ncbi:hypothetical protein DEI83_06270 [Curtobacterium sp. MCBD17_021]|nr:hypothetical protein DEI83_06270 [Curtobacterium sp. MCBD17_021]
MTDPVHTDALRKSVNFEADSDTAFARGVMLLQRAVIASADELDRVRSVIANAPHDNHCPVSDRGAYFGTTYPYAPRCTCWKADAL